MPNRNAKRVGMVGLGAALAVLAVTSAAFACTELSGQITIAGINGTTVDGVSNGSVTYLGNGGDFGSGLNNDGYCNGLPTSRTALNTSATTNASPFDFSLAVAPYTCKTQIGAKQVPDGDLEVRWVKTEAAIDSTWPYPACHSGVLANKTTTNNPTSRWVPLGTMKIINGSGSGQYALPATMFGPGNICVEYTKTNLEPLLASGTNTAPPIVFIDKVNLI